MISAAGRKRIAAAQRARWGEGEARGLAGSGYCLTTASSSCSIARPASQESTRRSATLHRARQP